MVVTTEVSVPPGTVACVAGVADETTDGSVTAGVVAGAGEVGPEVSGVLG